MKNCTKCKIIKQDDDFYKSSTNSSGLNCWCISCYSEYQKLKRIRLGKPTNKGSYRGFIVTHKQVGNILGNIKKRVSGYRKYQTGKTKLIKTLIYDLDISFVKKILNDFCLNNYHSWAPKHPFKPSIDRIDSNKGYTKDNVKVMWLIENYCKNDFTEEDVIEFCKRKLKIIK